MWILWRHSTGSEIQGGVEDVTFEDCTSTGVSGIRISQQAHRGGYLKNAAFRNITFDWGDSFAFEKKTYLFGVGQSYANGGPVCPGFKPVTALDYSAVHSTCYTVPPQFMNAPPPSPTRRRYMCADVHALCTATPLHAHAQATTNDGFRRIQRPSSAQSAGWIKLGQLRMRSSARCWCLHKYND